VRVLIHGQAHPVEAQAGHDDYLPAIVMACNTLRKTTDLEKQVCARLKSTHALESSVKLIGVNLGVTNA